MHELLAAVCHPHRAPLMVPRTFIRDVLITEIRDVIPGHPYLAFPLIGIGIEYLGRALDTAHDWDYTYRPNVQQPFDRAITTLFPRAYHGIRLRQLMRNGLLHFYAPKPGLALSRLSDPGVSNTITHANHPYLDSRGDITLVVEYLFDDFVDACERVMRMRFPRANKMSRRFIRTDLRIGP
jgi:hypothetical protein